MKNFLYSVSVFTLFIVPFMAVADHTVPHTIQQLREQIRILEEQIHVLQQGQPLSYEPLPPLQPARSLSSFQQNLSFGMRDSNEVRDLQEFLTNGGYYNGPVTGNFFILTLAAVRQFQEAQRIPSTGFFGLQSRGAANAAVVELVGPHKEISVPTVAATATSSFPVALPSASSTVTTTFPFPLSNPNTTLNTATSTATTTPPIPPSPPQPSPSLSPVFAFLSPSGNETIEIGRAFTIRWTSSGEAVQTVRISLYKAGSFKEFAVVDVPNNGSYTWTVPSYLSAASDYSIRLFNASYPNSFTDSVHFSLAAGSSTPLTALPPPPSSAPSAPVFTITSPVGGESFARGTTTVAITWQSTGENVSVVRLSLYKSGGFKDFVAVDVPNTGSYAWTVPANLTPGSFYSIRIFNLSYPNDYRDSGYFSVQ